VEEVQKPKRRIRYRGTHPRRFEEKYKELRAAEHPGTVQKVIESGKTPAGTHRPVCVAEIIEVLEPKPGDVALDATLGHGGHAQELLTRIMPGGKLLGMDADPVELPKTEVRLRDMGFDALVTRRSNYAGAFRFVHEQGLDGVDIVLADLGLSSMQIDNPARGFTFKFDGPLDMRMNPARGEPASAFIARWMETDWATALEANADEPDAGAMARGLMAAHTSRAILTTKDLASAAREAALAIHPRADKTAVEQTVRRVFQAVRIAVNDEFGALESLLRDLPLILRPAGRVAVLTFHSGEDRRVKKAFQDGLRTGIYSVVARDVIRPAPEEVRSNPRAAPAKLRWARRSEAP
jgi:16S rRNA (cytosine1402-N4)-methyltransferase